MDQFEELDVLLTADNSSGNQKLYLTRQDDEMWFTLAGEYKNENIQIDFNNIDRDELKELRDMIDIFLED